MRIFSKFCGISGEVCRLEKRIKMFVIPLSIVILTLYLTYHYTLVGFLTSFVEASLGVFLGWTTIRQIIIHVHKRRKNHSTVKRVAVQISLSIIVSSILVIILFYSHTQLFDVEKSTSQYFFHLKGLVINMSFFALFVNGVYEVIFSIENLTRERAEKEKIQKILLESRLSNLRNQINPHFLFNTFNALSELIEEDPRRASNIVIELSDVYRYVLNMREKNWVQLSREIQITHSFIEVLKIRYEENIEININIDEKWMNYLLPPLAMQMLIENAIKHNEISSTKKLVVDITANDDVLTVQNIKQKRIIENTNSNGMGLKNIQERYHYLSNKAVEIDDKEDFFIVKLPLIVLKEIDAD